MKKIITTVFLILGLISYSQESEFKFTKDGLTDYIVIKVEDNSQNELYDKTINWINTVYNSPSNVLKAQVKDEYIRFEGIKDYCVYQIEISFKDGKYKFDVLSYRHLTTNSNLLDITLWFNNDGSIKNKRCERLILEHQEFFNQLNLSLKNFIMTNANKNKDW